MISDVLALIDFYVDNGIVETDDNGKETFPVTAAQIGTDMKVKGKGKGKGKRGGIGVALALMLPLPAPPPPSCRCSWKHVQVLGPTADLSSTISKASSHSPKKQNDE